jgi:hypothetical protein
MKHWPNLLIALAVCSLVVFVWRACPRAPVGEQELQETQREAREQAETRLNQLESEARDVGDSDLLDTLNRTLRGEPTH